MSAGNQGFLGIPTASGSIASASSGSGALSFIQAFTLNSAQATIDFQGIPQIYTNLLIYFLGRSDSSTSPVLVSLQFNGDSGSNYQYEAVIGVDGGVVSAIGGDTQTSIAIGATSAADGNSNYPGGGTINIVYYRSSSFYKVAVSQFGYFWSTLHFREYGGSGLWRSLNAINRATLTTTGNFVSGSQAVLYGIS